MKIAILGAVPKGDKIRETWQDWKPVYQQAFSAIDGCKVIDGDRWRTESQPLLTVGHDSHLIKHSDVVVVNADSKMGAGTAMEMMIAKYFEKPVVVVLPKDTHHRRSNIMFENELIEDWIHPFIFTVADEIVETVDQAAKWLRIFKTKPDFEVKSINVIDDAISQFENFCKENNYGEL